jgi:Ser/Thr protein kinase RdoA (MazF antagonist)
LERLIKDRFNDEILAEARAKYRIQPDKIKLLDGFESYIFEFSVDDEDFILRIGHSHRRNLNLISGEVDWINFLANGGASVARAIYSDEGNLVETIDDQQGGQFLTTAFVRAPGDPPSEETWGPTLFRRYGQLIGRMHALSKNYKPPNREIRRPDWDDPLMLDVVGWLQSTESLAVRRFEELADYLDHLPRDVENYGMVHQDAHGGNFFVNNAGEITLFDFDDCCYSWYINDLAIVLFYALAGRGYDSKFVPKFMKPFLAGYVKENILEPSSLAEIPNFLKLREIDLYAVIHRSFDVNELQNPWVANFMDNRKYRIENNVPYVDFDFAELGDLID